MKHKALIITLIILVAFGAAIFMLNKKGNPGIEVSTSSVTRGNLIAYFSTSGTVESKNSKDYLIQTPAKVLKVNFNVGDKVKKGDIIAQLDVQDMSLQLKTAQKQYNIAKIQLNALINQKNNSKSTPSTPSNPFGAGNYQSASSGNINDQINIQENQVDIARLNIQSIRQTMAKQQRYIKADFNGIITALNIKEGGMTNPAMPAVSIEDISNLRVAINVNQYDVAKIRPGLDANVKFNGRSFRGVVQSIDPVAIKSMSPAGSDTTVRTIVALLQNDGSIKSGYDVDVDIKTGEARNVLKLPAEAVLTDKEGNETAYVVQNGIARLRKIKTGLSSDIESEIRSGVNVNDKVILNPPTGVREGVKVFERVVKK